MSSVWAFSSIPGENSRPYPCCSSSAQNACESSNVARQCDQAPSLTRDASDHQERPPHGDRHCHPSARHHHGVLYGHDHGRGPCALHGLEGVTTP